MKVTAIDTATPEVGNPLTVGSEPTGLALSPAGTTLYVAEHAEGRISVVDTAAFTVGNTIADPANPRALLVTNDGDADEGDELLVVPEFFGEPDDDGEASNTGRTGRVRIYRTSDLAPPDVDRLRSGRQRLRRHVRRAEPALVGVDAWRPHLRDLGVGVAGPAPSSTATSSPSFTSPTSRPAPRSTRRTAPPASRRRSSTR